MSEETIFVGGFELTREGEELYVRDVDLAERLGYAQPRQIRELIKRWKDGLGVCRTVRKTAESQGGRPGVEYWLTEPQAYFVIAKSETPRATETLMAMSKALAAARAQWARNREVGGWSLAELVRKIIAPAPAQWELMFSQTLVSELCRVWRKSWDGGVHPVWLRRVYGEIYDWVFSTQIGRELRARNPNPRFGNNRSQDLTPEAKQYLRDQLKIIEAIARTSADRRDFRARMHREYGGAMLQLPFAS